MSPELVFFIVFLFPVIIALLPGTAAQMDCYGKAKNKKLIQLKGMARFLFVRTNTFFLDKKNYISKLSFIVQIINYILVTLGLIIEILCNFVYPESIVGISVFLFLLGYCFCGAVISTIFSFIGHAYMDKLEKQKKELESQSFDENSLNKN